MTETEQEIDVGGPGTDAVNGGQHGVGLVRRLGYERGQIKLTPLDRFCDRLERANLRSRKSGAGELRRARAQDRCVVERVQGLVEPRPDRLCARGRELLRDDDRGEAGKSVRPSPQRRPPGPRQDRPEAPTRLDEAGDGVIEIGFGVDEEHERGAASTNAMATQPLSGTARARMTVFRFAPSPNGYLHLGHALSALINFEMARATGGRFLLRIEDIDATRCRPQYEDAIYEDLAWLGLTWEEPVRPQSAHLEDYRAALARLDAFVYPSFETRGEIARLVAERERHAPWPRDPDGAPLYPGAARVLSAAERRRHMAAGEPYALRLDTAAALARTGPLTWIETGCGDETATARPEMWGDVIVARKETPTSYHL